MNMLRNKIQKRIGKKSAKQRLSYQPAKSKDVRKTEGTLQGCRSRPFWLEPEPFFGSGSGSYSYSTEL